MSFTCSACGAAVCERVSVKRPNASLYKTEFVSCVGCKAMYHWPKKLTSEEGPGIPDTYMQPLGEWKPSGQMANGNLDSETKVIQEAALRANRAKRKL